MGLLPLVRMSARVASLLFVVLLLSEGCGDESAPETALPVSRAEVDPVAFALVESAMDAHGSAVLDQAELSFSFRGTLFTIRREGGQFRYARTLTDSLGRTMEEVVDNDGTHRFLEGAPMPMDALETRRAETAVNSVAYFALLPGLLRDPAVQLRSHGTETIRGEPYERVEVTFAQEGGGRDYEDRYLYWFHADHHTMDYLAYSYELGANETGPNATGSRFREVIRVQDVGGVRMQGYRNLTADVGDTLERYPALYEADSLRVVSEVVLDSIRVTPL
jgi:hypothetical protein